MLHSNILTGLFGDKARVQLRTSPGCGASGQIFTVAPASVESAQLERFRVFQMIQTPNTTITMPAAKPPYIGGGVVRATVEIKPPETTNEIPSTYGHLPAMILQ